MRPAARILTQLNPWPRSWVGWSDSGFSVQQLEPARLCGGRMLTMSHMQISTETAILRISVDTLIAEHGKWRVVMAAIKAMVRGRRRVQTIRPMDLPPALRRDLGLPAVVDPPRLPTVMMVYFRP